MSSRLGIVALRNPSGALCSPGIPHVEQNENLDSWYQSPYRRPSDLSLGQLELDAAVATVSDLVAAGVKRLEFAEPSSREAVCGNAGFDE